MKLIGTFTEAQLEAGEDKAACKKTERESGGAIRYFIPKFRRRNGKTIKELYGMTIEEYCNSSVI